MLRHDRNFCPECGRVVDLEALKKIGIHPPDMSAKKEYFWSTGDPSVFSKPGDPDFNPALAGL